MSVLLAESVGSLGPQAFLDGPAAGLLRTRNTDADSPPGTWTDLAGLRTDDGAVVRRLHAHLVAVEATPPAAATRYVAEALPGRVAELVGLVLGTASAGLLVDLDDVEWRLQEGYADLVRLSRSRVVVVAGHPWADAEAEADADDVVVVPDDDALVAVTVGHLVAALDPLVDLCVALGGSGRRALWNEVGDGLAMAIAYCPSLPVTGGPVALLRAAASSPLAPWPRPARVGVDPCGGCYLAQKGGCCLAYTAPAQQREGADPDYCSTCRFRDPADVDARQLAWHDEQRRLA